MSFKFRQILSEPFVQFLFSGGLLFLLVSGIQQENERQSREIIVTNEQVNLMIIKYKTQTGSLPSKEQLDALINNYIKEEISYREAKKLGLDKDDEIIRRRLSQKFDFLQSDLVEIKQPDKEDLLNFYNNHPHLFKTDTTVDFSHIYFSTDGGSDSIARRRAEKVLGQMKHGKFERPREKGDHFPLQYDYTQQTRSDIKQNFGDKQIVDELIKGPLNTWLGPFQSGYGWHLVLIGKREPGRILQFKSVEEEVHRRFLDSARTAENKKRAQQLNEEYIINRAYLDAE